jgi:hypothetical protein
MSEGIENNAVCINVTSEDDYATPKTIVELGCENEK